MYINMKRTIVEIMAYKEIQKYCDDKHIKGLFITGNFKHGGVYNSDLNIGGYYSTKHKYFDKEFIYKHGNNYFFNLENPSSKLFNIDIKILK